MKKQFFLLVTSFFLITLFTIAIEIFQYFLFEGDNGFIRFCLLLFIICLLYFFAYPLSYYFFQKMKLTISLRRAFEQKEAMSQHFMSIYNNSYYEREFSNHIQICKTCIQNDMTYFNACFDLCHCLIQFFIYAFFICYTQYYLIIPLLALIGCGFFIKYAYAKKELDSKIENVEEERRAEYLKDILLDYDKLRDIKLNSYEKEIALKSTSAFYTGLVKRYKLRRKNAFWYEMINTFLFVGVAAILATMIFFTKGYTISQLIVIISCLLKSVHLLTPTTDAFSEYIKGKGYRTQFDKCLNIPYPKYSFTGVKIDAIKSICFEHVFFAYSGEEYIIKDCNFEWNTGESISIIGENGSGKTTFLKLILGINKPTKGIILINDIPMEDIDFYSYIRLVGSCLQEYAKFADTLYNNIALGRSSRINFPRLCAELSLDKLIHLLPENEQTLLGKDIYPDAVDVSGGEWQKISIARSLFTDSNFLVFDEPTSALDLNSEVEFFKFLKSKLKGKTFFLITHRVGFAKLSDRILVLENGRIIEDGTPEQLMELKGKYFKMFFLQKNMFKE